MVARTKQPTNLMVLISTIPKLYCTETLIPLDLYYLSRSTLYVTLKEKSFEIDTKYGNIPREFLIERVR